MAAPDLKSLAKQISADVLSAMSIGLTAPITMMIRHEPGSNIYCLVWDASKIYASMVGISIFLAILIVAPLAKMEKFTEIMSITKIYIF